MNASPPSVVRKSTGLTWAPEVPSDWDIKRGKFLFDLQKRAVLPDDDIVTAFRDGQVTLRKNRRTDGFTNALKEAGYQRVHKGDLVIHAMDAFAGAVGVSDADGKCTPVYSCCTPKEGVSAEFYARMIRTMALSGFIESLAKGIRERSTDFRWREFAEQPLPVPPIEQQLSINEFLDRETGQIDGLIEKKTRFIALLKEKILSFSDSCVTGRDDSQRALKDVDIPWAPQIPEGWTMRKGKHLFEEMARPLGPDDEIITAFRDGQVCLRSKRRTEGYTFAEKEVGYQRILKGDLVIHTMDAFAGAIGVSEDDGKATGEYAVCKPRSDEAVPEYYAYLLRCMARRNYIYVLCPSVRERAPRFRFVRFAPVKLPVPPREEQLEIVDRIERATARMKNLIALTERSIDLLREKRAALITAAVTGKIDVRRAA